MAVVGDVDPDTLGKLLDKTFGQPAGKGGSDRRCPISSPPSLRNAPSFARRAADRRDVRRPRHPAPRSGFHGSLRRQPYSRRRQSVVAASTARSARSVASLIRSINRWSGWIIRHSSSATPARAPIAPATRSRPSTRKSPYGDEGPTQKELDEAKSYLKGSQMLALDTSAKLASAMLQFQLDGLPNRLYREA